MMGRNIQSILQFALLSNCLILLLQVCVHVSIITVVAFKMSVS